MRQEINRDIKILVKKIISTAEAGKLIPNNSSVMIGGFLRCGTPAKLIDELVKNNTSGLTLIANDTSTPDFDRGKLVVNKQTKKPLWRISEPIRKPADR